MALGFALHQGQVELARAEAEAVVGGGNIIGGLYVVGVPYDFRYTRLAFSKAIYDIGAAPMRKKKIVDLNKINQFDKRRAHLLEAGHPAMTHPRLARAMVNLSGADKILDPFCGAGGILIEAGLCGLSCVGFDIDEKMLERARKNLDFFGIKDYTLMKKDASAFVGKYTAVVTDLPFGLSTKLTVDAEKLYLSFLKNLKRNKIKKAVVGFPDFVDYISIVEKSGYKIKNIFSYYLHKSLSKKIVVIEL